MCSSRKCPYPPLGWSLEILTGRGVSIANSLFKLKIPVSWEGSNQRTILVGGMDNF